MNWKFAMAAICFIADHSVVQAQRLKPKDSTELYANINKAWVSNNDDSALMYFDNALGVAKRTHWLEGEGIVLGHMGGYAFEVQNNYVRSLSLLHRSLEISQEYKDTVQVAYVLTRLSTVYNAVDDFVNALFYGRSAYSLAKASNDPTLIWMSAYNLGLAYGNLNLKDSSLLLFQDCYQVANGIADDSKPFKVSIAMRGLGYAHLLLGNDQIASAYLFKSILLASKLNNDYLDSEIYTTLSDLYMQSHRYDSAIFYANSSLTSAHKVPIAKNILRNYRQLAHLYEGRNNDSAVKYFKLASVTSDSIFSTKTKLELANLASAERDRQREISEQKKNEAKQRAVSIQFALIALGIIVFVIMFLVLSQSIIARSGLIRFLGVIALLLVFEFINLFIHPFIGDFFHHSPLWMLITMVCIAALLVPAHHKLEKWITVKLVEKNKQTRLSAAKRTIAQLESDKET